MSLRCVLRPALLFLATILAAAAPLSLLAQEFNPAIPKGDFGFGSDSGDEGPKITFSAEYELKKDSREGQLKVTAILAEGWHVYSVTQQKGGTMPSKIKVAESADFKLLGPFVPDRSPNVKQIKEYQVPIEEHEGQVTWSAPLEIVQGVNPESLE